MGTELIGYGTGTAGLVSVVIPTYNRAYSIPKTVDSVLNQTYSNVEIIIVDDGSTDNTRRIVENYHQKVRYYYQENAGVSNARNFGMEHACGEYIALLDSDDTWVPWKLELQIEFLNAFPAVGMVFSDMTAVDDDDRILEKKYMRKFFRSFMRNPPDSIFTSRGVVSSFWPKAPGFLQSTHYYWGDIFSRLLLGNLVFTGSVLFRRERLFQVGGYDPTLKYSGEDYEFYLRTAFYGPIGLLDIPTCLYRIGNADQLTAPRFMIHMAQNNLTTVIRWLNRGGERVTLPGSLIRNHLAHCYAWLGENQLWHNEHKHARKNLWKSIHLSPLNLKSIVLLISSWLPPFLFQSAVKIYKRQKKNASRKKHEPYSIYLLFSFGLNSFYMLTT